MIKYLTSLLILVWCGCAPGPTKKQVTNQDTEYGYSIQHRYAAFNLQKLTAENAEVRVRRNLVFESNRGQTDWIKLELPSGNVSYQKEDVNDFLRNNLGEMYSTQLHSVIGTKIQVNGIEEGTLAPKDFGDKDFIVVVEGVKIAELYEDQEFDPRLVLVGAAGGVLGGVLGGAMSSALYFRFKVNDEAEKGRCRGYEANIHIAVYQKNKNGLVFDYAMWVNGSMNHDIYHEMSRVISFSTQRMVNDWNWSTKNGPYIDRIGKSKIQKEAEETFKLKVYVHPITTIVGAISDDYYNNVYLTLEKYSSKNKSWIFQPHCYWGERDSIRSLFGVGVEMGFRQYFSDSEINGVYIQEMAGIDLVPTFAYPSSWDLYNPNYREDPSTDITWDKGKNFFLSIMGHVGYKTKTSPSVMIDVGCGYKASDIEVKDDYYLTTAFVIDSYIGIGW